jgi:hypothetical protein
MVEFATWTTEVLTLSDGVSQFLLFLEDACASQKWSGWSDWLELGWSEQAGGG